MKVWIVLENEFHEVNDVKVFDSEIKAIEYSEKREKENNDFYNSKIREENFKNITGLSFDIEEHEIL